MLGIARKLHIIMINHQLKKYINQILKRILYQFYINKKRKLFLLSLPPDLRGELTEMIKKLQFV